MEPTAKTETIANLVEGLPRLRVYDEEISAYEEHSFVSTIPVADKNTYLGIEVETENVKLFNSSYSPYWKITEDGSLRNSGREFVSIPIKAFRVENALSTLFKYQINPDIEFSERTSIHVHMNVRTMTLEQLRAMVLLYLLFERSMFRYVDKDRYNNIFCVPLNETDFGTRLRELFNIDHLTLAWTKYTALNLLPIWEKGTIEFRHLHGTKNIPEIMGWINLILSLKKMALRTDPKVIWDRIETLNTSSQYHAFASEVFGDYFPSLDQKFLEKDMAACCSYIKTKCISNPWADGLLSAFHPESVLYKYSLLGNKSNYFFTSRVQEEFVDDMPEAIPFSPPTGPWVSTTGTPTITTGNGGAGGGNANNNLDLSMDALLQMTRQAQPPRAPVNPPWFDVPNIRREGVAQMDNAGRPVQRPRGRPRNNF